jgi:sugar phosphate isomerase/epimerase
MTEYQLGRKFNDAFKQTALGVSIGEQNQLAEFAKVLRSGAQMAEIDLASLYGFTGNGTPATRMGKTEREAFGNLAKTNQADLSIHAPWSINPSGINPQSGERDMEYMALMKNEMKAAINFADDVSKSMGKHNMPIIFHAASDHFGNPDPKLRLIAYDNEADKIFPIKEQKLDNMTAEKFRQLYGDDTYNRVKIGLKPSEDGKGIILTPEAAFQFQKDQLRINMNQERVNLEINQRELEMQKFRLVNELAEASAGGDLARIDKLNKTKDAYDQMLKDLNVRKDRIDNGIEHINERLVRYDEKAPLLAAEGIKDAALMSARSTTKPMILVENTMTPEMSLSKPVDVAKAVEQARRLFVDAATKDEKLNLSKSDAEDLANQLIGVNLDVGHLNIFKSYGLDNRKIVSMLTEQGKLDDKTRVRLADYIKRYHLNDNMGDIDAHLPLGEGTTPIKEIYETLRNAGVEAPAIMEVFGGQGGIEAGMTQSLEYLGAPIYGDVPFTSLPTYAANPYSSIIGDYSHYSNLGLRQDLFSYGGFTGLSPILGGGYMENTRGGGGGFSGAPMA